MLILLPPSEGKTPAADGPAVDPAALWLPGLAAARRRVLGRVVAMCKRTSNRSVGESLRVLGLTDNQRDEIGRNARLLSAPAGPAVEVYSGVLYAALDAGSLSADARDWLHRSAVVFSGLWGVVRLEDRIPAYRCPVGVTLPAPVGGLTAYWRRVLKPRLDQAAGNGPVLDLRSGAYGAMWAPATAETATVRVLHERVVGGVPQRSVVSHFNKATKGRLVRALAEANPGLSTIDEVAVALRDLDYTVEEQQARPGGPRLLDVIVSEL